MNDLRIKEEEDEEFELAFKSLMQESVSKASGPKVGSSSSASSSGQSKIAPGVLTGDRMGKRCLS